MHCLELIVQAIPVTFDMQYLCNGINDLSSSGMCEFVGVCIWVCVYQLTTAGLSTTAPGGMTTQDRGS